YRLFTCAKEGVITMDDRFYSLLPLLFLIVFVQGLWIFFDARRREERWYWLWGLFGLLNFPSSLIIYLLITRTFDTLEKEKCPECGQELKRDWNYCPNCARKIEK
ncbi:MAG TPA: zinc ribbon domain-containing protein, partial [Halanaerobiales bacterium]|nr:zinc ribbon domain-containing protein [Halanaerobiales bacterium]